MYRGNASKSALKIYDACCRLQVSVSESAAVHLLYSPTLYTLTTSFYTETAYFTNQLLCMQNI